MIVVAVAEAVAVAVVVGQIMVMAAGITMLGL